MRRLCASKTKERINRSFDVTLGACKGGTVTQQIDTSPLCRALFADFGGKVQAIPDRSAIANSMTCGGATLRFAAVPHDRFEWQEMVAGESRFAVWESGESPVRYDVLCLVNMPAGQVSAPDIRGLYIARSREQQGSVVMFKIVDNPNYQQNVNIGPILTDEGGRELVKQTIEDARLFVPMLLTPEESIAAAEELELAASVYAAPPPEA